MRKATLVASESSVEATVHEQVREHIDPRHRGKQTRLVWKQVLGSKGC